MDSLTIGQAKGTPHEAKNRSRERHLPLRRLFPGMLAAVVATPHFLFVCLPCVPPTDAVIPGQRFPFACRSRPLRSSASLGACLSLYKLFAACVLTLCAAPGLDMPSPRDPLAVPPSKQFVHFDSPLTQYTKHMSTGPSLTFTEMRLSRTSPRASMQVLLLVATAACCLSTVNAQLEPQSIPATTAETVTCYPADSLAWRSIPGKMIVHGAPFVKKPKAPVPIAPPQPEPLPVKPLPKEDAVNVGVGPAGGIKPVPVPKPAVQPPVQTTKPPVIIGSPKPHMDPVASPERAIPAVRYLQEQQEEQKLAGAVVDGVAVETPNDMGQEDELTAEDKAAIARESMYANIQLKGLNWVSWDGGAKGGREGGWLVFLSIAEVHMFNVILYFILPIQFGLDRINIFEGTNYKVREYKKKGERAKEKELRLRLLYPPYLTFLPHFLPTSHPIDH